MNTSFTTLRWVGQTDGHLVLLDQTRLPSHEVELACHDLATLIEAIRSLRVRGAPAIGVAAAYGVCLGVQRAGGTDEAAFFDQLDQVTAQLAASRPTAVNLFWALDRMKRKANELRGCKSSDQIAEILLEEARTVEQEDRDMCEAIGRHGVPLLADTSGVLTHCNAGALATAGSGTALAVIYAAWASGSRPRVYADETRPLLQGARLTAWELRRQGIDVTLICDSAAAQVMREGRVQAVVTGADRIAGNGDAANKIGTYGLALAAAAHEIPFYVAAPTSTFDLTLDRGEKIPIEERAAEEITRGFGPPTAPEGIDVYNPAFDVTPARLITAIVCEHGIIRPVTPERIAKFVSAV